MPTTIAFMPRLARMPAELAGSPGRITASQGVPNESAHLASDCHPDRARIRTDGRARVCDDNHLFRSHARYTRV
jgi:hypothetical protein